MLLQSITIDNGNVDETTCNQGVPLLEHGLDCNSFFLEVNKDNDKESNLLKRTMGKCTIVSWSLSSNGCISIKGKHLRSHFEGPILKLASHEYGLQLRLISIKMI